MTLHYIGKAGEEKGIWCCISLVSKNLEIMTLGKIIVKNKLFHDPLAWISA